PVVQPAARGLAGRVTEPAATPGQARDECVLRRVVRRAGARRAATRPAPRRRLRPPQGRGDDDRDRADVRSGGMKRPEQHGRTEQDRPRQTCADDDDRRWSVKAGSQVSVIIPVYNGERYLAEAVHSILAQTVPTLEIIVVDDGSTDGTARVAQRFGDAVCYVYQPNRGPAAARNRGLERARGEIVAFLDADDLWREGKLACQCARLEADPTLDIVLGHTQFVRH